VDYAGTCFRLCFQGIWRARRGSNSRPNAPEAFALTGQLVRSFDWRIAECLKTGLGDFAEYPHRLHFPVQEPARDPRRDRLSTSENIA